MSFNQLHSVGSRAVGELLKTKTILLIDDMADARGLTRAMLSLCDLRKVKEASSPQNAVRVLETSKIELVLCDYNLGNARDGQQLYEDMIERKLIDHSSVFIMITGERTYEHVVRDAELAPDDYIIKPFTPALIYARLVRAFHRKSDLKVVIDAMTKKDWPLAVKCCQALLARPGNKFVLDIRRMLGESLFNGGRLDDAEQIYTTINSELGLPWARYGLARIQRLRGQFATATESLERIIRDTPTFIKAQDELAELYQELGNFEQSAVVLERANQLSPNNVKRQKKLAQAAFTTGNLELAERVLSNIVETGKHSVSHSADDYTLLSKVISMQGRDEEGLEMLASASQRFGGAETTVIAQLASKAIILFDRGETAESLQALQAARSAIHPELTLSESVIMDLAEAALRHGDELFCAEMLARLPKGDAFLGLAQARIISSMYERAGRADLSGDMLQARREEVMALNNQAVLAARDKKYAEAMPIIRKAAQALPDDLRVISNMSKVLIAMARDEGLSDPLKQEIREALHLLGKISQTAEQELLALYQKVFGPLEPSA